MPEWGPNGCAGLVREPVVRAGCQTRYVVIEIDEPEPLGLTWTATPLEDVAEAVERLRNKEGNPVHIVIKP